MLTAAALAWTCVTWAWAAATTVSGDGIVGCVRERSLEIVGLRFEEVEFRLDEVGPALGQIGAGGPDVVGGSLVVGLRRRRRVERCERGQRSDVGREVLAERGVGVLDIRCGIVVVGATRRQHADTDERGETDAQLIAS